jgi:hypothetical protein
MDKREKNPGQAKKKKNPTGGMDVCVVFVVRTVAWNVSDMKGRKRTNTEQKWIKWENPGIKKKIPRGAWMFVLFVVRTVVWNVK